MRVGVFFFGGVEIDDAGAGSPGTDEPAVRAEGLLARTRAAARHGRAGRGARATTATGSPSTTSSTRATRSSRTASCSRAFLAERTSRIRIGTMFNIVAQWHPLRLAEDFATLHNLSGGRAILGVGRGTVPREIQSLSGNRVSIGSFDNPDMADADRVNREVTDEALEIIKLAFENETFSYKGKYFELPPARHPRSRGVRRDADVDSQAEVSRTRSGRRSRRHPRSSTRRRSGHGGVFWNQNHKLHQAVLRSVRRGVGRARTTVPSSAPGEKRLLVLNVRVEDTYEEALDSARPGHDEFWKFLGPYGWSRGYMGDDGKPVAPGPHPDARELDGSEDVGGRLRPSKWPRASSATRTRSRCKTSSCSRTSPATATRRPTSR